MPYYHGSNAPGIKKLVTSHSLDGKVYVTSSRLVALTYAAKVFPNNFTTRKDGQEIFLEHLPNLFEIMLKGKSGYIYTLEDKNYFPVKQSKNCGHLNCFYINEDVNVIKCEFIEDLYSELLKYAKTGEFKIIPYNEISQSERERAIREIAGYAKTFSEKKLNQPNIYGKLFLEAEKQFNRKNKE